MSYEDFVIADYTFIAAPQKNTVSGLYDPMFPVVKHTSKYAEEGELFE
jgi:hypothetical protein